MPPTTAVPLLLPVPLLLSIIALPLGSMSECFLGALFDAVSIRLDEVRESPAAFTGNALEFLYKLMSLKANSYLFVTPFFTRLVGVLSVLEAAIYFPSRYFPINPAFDTPEEVGLPAPPAAARPAKPILVLPVLPLLPFCVFWRPKPLLLSRR